MGKETEAKRYLLTLINKYPESFEGHKLLAEVYEKKEESQMQFQNI